MNFNSDKYFSLKKRYEEAKDDLKYWYRDDPIYYIEKLEEITDEMLKSLATEWLNNDVYNKEYLHKEEE